MGKLNPTLLRYLTDEDVAILAGVEMGMRNHELVSAPLAVSLSKLQISGSHRILRELCKHRLLSYERGKKYDGYRLTNLGYDYLALNNLTKRNIISSFGNQIGVGKESNIYTVATEEEEELCLKLHRLGRVCFRKVTEKRDYHKHAKSLSWLYLSKLSATKEFAYMKALHDEGFPVPRPISFNRHCVVMELIKGTLLNHILELKNPEKLYDQLMDLIIRFANCGLIHGDFNEFNIMVTEEEDAVIIDFPQMLSTEHSDAEMYFNRDVNCIRTFFKKRFRYESEFFPKFSDVDRTCSLDAQVRCTGFTREMARSLDIELGLENEDSSDENEKDENEVDDEEKQERHNEREKETCQDNVSDKNGRLSESISKEFDEKINVGSSPNVGTGDTFSDAESNKETNDGGSSDVDSGDAFSESDKFSVSSTVNSHHDEIKKRIKQQIRKKKLKESQKRCYAKGEASAVRRSRRQNANHIKESHDFWGM
ncbi:serine/threonine-protein kinase rio2 [Coccinella septempunctata]|uniref:serine/threonine-protein kinase rio2 n=1 Tax=Coccinella septempunctata TaxID=41139 RepID=UPI001D05EFE5|nr:serine/threonine-protein kinase rio2 [Coccinella septempunctata]